MALDADFNMNYTLECTGLGLVGTRLDYKTGENEKKT